MKHLLALDFDGTLCVDGTISKATYDALQKWRETGNVVALVTGRDWNLVMRAKQDFELPMDYFVCANGSVGYEKDGTLIFENALDNVWIERLIHDDILNQSGYFIVSNASGRYLVDNYSDALDLSYFHFTDTLPLAQISTLGSVYQMDTVYDSHEAMLDASQKVQEKYGEQISVHPNIFTIDFGAPCVSKATGIDALIARIGIDPKHVRCAGDGFNDYPMIEKFGGFAMAQGVKPLKDIAIKTISDVSEAVEYLLQSV